ncbi:MAG: DsbA family protein, partial [Candidatus Nanohaloarchaeota archaeon QJJ-5]|nr:DsbA family protein [Candidatus Nanohaloarchaeota archaeon QJJ-5]
MLDKLFYLFVLTFVIFTTVGSAGLTDNVDEPLNVGEGSGELEWERGTVDVDGVPFIGSPNAPVKMVVYCDIFGPYCNQQWKETMPRLVEDYVAEGDVQLFYKHLPVVGGTQPGIASECIQRESSEAYYEFIDSHFNQFESMRTLYQENENGYDGLIKDWAVELGVDSDQFENCYDNQETQSILQSHSSEAQNLG